MNCRDFLTRHTEYVDGVLDAAAAASMAAHVHACATCARYDRVVRRGGQLVRELLPAIEVSADFEPRMRHRLYHERDDMSRRRAGAASVFGAAASVVLVVAAAGTLAVLSDRTPVVDAHVVWAEAPTRYTPIESRSIAVATPHTIPAADTPSATTKAEPSTPAESREAPVEVARPEAWPVYSRGAVAVAFPAVKKPDFVAPADFRQPAARYDAGPILIRY